MKRSVRESNKKFWQEHMVLWENSNQSQRVYCRENNLKYSTFLYWRIHLKKQPSDQPLQIVQLKEEIQVSQKLCGQARQSSVIKLWFGPYRLEVDSSICPETLSRLVCMLKSI